MSTTAGSRKVPTATIPSTRPEAELRRPLDRRVVNGRMSLRLCAPLRSYCSCGPTIRRAIATLSSPGRTGSCPAASLSLRNPAPGLNRELALDLIQELALDLIQERGARQPGRAPGSRSAAG